MITHFIRMTQSSTEGQDMSRLRDAGSHQLNFCPGFDGSAVMLADRGVLAGTPTRGGAEESEARGCHDG